VNEEITIRLATRKDAEEIALESMAEIEHNMGWSWHPDRVACAIDDQNTNVAVAVLGDVMLGFGIMEYEEESAHLVLFAIREDARRRGVGSALLLWLEKVAYVAGVSLLKVEARVSNVGARAFYQNRGYSESDVVADMYRSEGGVCFEKPIGAGASKN